MYPSLKNYRHQIVNGRPLPPVNLRPREALGAFISCAVGQFLDKSNKWTVASTPEINNDGIVFCAEGPREGEGFLLEQVYVPFKDKPQNLDVTERIINSIQKKLKKGKQYGENCHLVVLCDQAGEANLEKIRNYLLNQDNFLSYWLIIRDTDLSQWSWGVITLKAITDPPFLYKFSIDENFDHWNVQVIGKVRGT